MNTCVFPNTYDCFCDKMKLEKLRKLVAPGRIELPRPCGHWILSPARLPIPPQGQLRKIERLEAGIWLLFRSGSSGISSTRQPPGIFFFSKTASRLVTFVVRMIPGCFLQVLKNGLYSTACENLRNSSILALGLL